MDIFFNFLIIVSDSYPHRPTGVCLVESQMIRSSYSQSVRRIIVFDTCADIGFAAAEELTEQGMRLDSDGDIEQLTKEQYIGCMSWRSPVRWCFK